MIRYYIFVIRWLYRNRNWGDSRQKFKAMNREWEGRNHDKNTIYKVDDGRRVSKKFGNH